MSGFFVVMFGLCLIAFVVAMARPSLVVKWGNRSRKEALMVFPMLAFCMLVAAITTFDKKDTTTNVQPATVATTSTPTVRDPNNTKQTWAFEHLENNSQHNLISLGEHLGTKYKSVPITKGNPSIIKAYYFQDADVTVFLNTYYKNVAYWRVGKHSE
ncbi:hypothetical protein [Halodesulfovibrio aestuarii]|uniref:hypothetical protein n=1 Tax=Halodesulfovibrio aestuarii TaxID=126333 RepID=UPI003D334E2B